MMTSQTPHAASLETACERTRQKRQMAADHPPDLLHTISLYEDGGFRRMCSADPWIGEDDTFLARSLQERSRHRASHPTLSTGPFVFDS